LTCRAFSLDNELIMKNAELTVSAPGRLCLLGEHQDYFGLAVLAAAIDLRIRISGRRIGEKKLILDLPDIQKKMDIPLGKELSYSRKRDYLRSGVNILSRRRVRWDSGWKCRISGDIPINSGSASSSALQVAWITFLLAAAENSQACDPGTAAELAFESEVAEFDEPGGKMDHFTSALGGVVSIHFTQPLKADLLAHSMGDFVLADSMVRKDTTGTLGFIKSNVLSAVERLKKVYPDFSLKHSPAEIVETSGAGFSPVEKRLLTGTLRTRDITAEGERLLRSGDMDHDRFGRLLNRQQKVIREDLKISSPRIDHMIDAAREAGALGAKINGSGEGGCIFAYCPGRTESVVKALKKLGSQVFIVRVGGGLTVHKRVTKKN
jgi:galactokinase